MSEQTRTQKKRASQTPSVNRTLFDNRTQKVGWQVQVPADIDEVLHTPGKPLEPDDRAFMESRLGHDFSQVRVHADARATESARELQAPAYTVGRDVVVDADEYAPGTSKGRQLLGHELVHVIQGESAARSANTIVSAPGDAAEREATQIAARMGGRPTLPTPSQTPAALVQRSGPAATGAGQKSSDQSGDETIDIDILAWSGSIDLVTQFAGAVSIGELDANSIDALVDAVHTEMKENPGFKIGHLQITGHGSPGWVSPGISRFLLTPAARARLAELTPYFASESSVTLYACRVASGTAGVGLIQELSDIWGVPVRGYTGVQHALGLYGAGYELERRPGEALGSPKDILVEQIEREVNETRFRTQIRVINRLEEAKESGILSDVVMQLKANLTWDGVVDLLTSRNVRFYPDLVARVNSLGLPGISVTEMMISAPSGLPVIAEEPPRVPAFTPTPIMVQDSLVVQFDTGKDVPTPDSQADIESFVAAYRQVFEEGGFDLTLTGDASRTGEETKNRDLSERRVDEVYSRMEKSLSAFGTKLRPKQGSIELIWQGEQRAIDEGKSELDNSPEYRVVTILLKYKVR